MNKNNKFCLTLLMLTLPLAASLEADPYTLPNLGGANDSINIVLDNGGATHGFAGDTVGFGFAVDWQSDSGHWLQFSTSYLTGQTAPSVNAGYSDLIGLNGGPVNYAVPANTFWTQSYSTGSTGTGDYHIDPNATAGNVDTGQLVFSFVVLNGDPNLGGTTQIGDLSYSFAANYSVSVDTPVSSPGDGTPEPATWAMLFSGLGVTGLIGRRKRRP